MIIYLDVLIAVNIFVTYFQLVCTRLITKSDTKKWGVFTAAFLGGLSSLIIFVDDISLLLSVCYKLFTAVIISGIAFLPKTKKLFLKQITAFFIVCFVFGGVMYFVEITLNINNILYMNGTVYFDVSIIFIVAMTLLCYGILLVADYILKRRASANTLYDAELYFRNESVKLKAFFDTGNHLSDGITSRPVIIVELEAIIGLLTQDEIAVLMTENPTEIPESLKKVFRIIPCTSVTGSALISGFVPEKLVITTKSFSYETAFLIVGVLNNRVSDGEYNCILNNEIFERGKRIEYKTVNKQG